MPDLKVGVGMSRNWDAESAGEEVVLSTLHKLGGKPDVLLVFATIHYEKDGGFEKFLRGVWKRLPEGTPLVGGTVAGFLNGYGSYTRGAVAIAMSCSEMDFTTAIGYRTKRNPSGAAKSCAMSIKNAFAKTKYKNRFVTALASGPIFPELPLVGPLNVVHNKHLSKLFAYFAQLSTFFLQKGPAREVEILKTLSSLLPECEILTGSLMDNFKFRSNYQFFDRKVYTNALVCMGIACDLYPRICTTHCSSPTGKKFKITKDMVWGHVLCTLDGKPAGERYLEAVGWPESIVNERVHSKTIFYPLGTVDNGIVAPNVIAVFLGNYLLLSHSMVSDEIHLLTTSGKNWITAVDSALAQTTGDMGFCISCELGVEMLDGKVSIIQQKLKNRFSDNFLVIYTAGEGTYSAKTKSPNCFQETFNIVTFESDN